MLVQILASSAWTGVVLTIGAPNTSNTLAVIRTACDRELANGATVNAPNGGEIWIAPSEHLLTWTRDAGCASVNLDLSRDGGLNWEPIAQNVSGSSYKWTVTGPYSNQTKLRVSNAFVPSWGPSCDPRLRFTTAFFPSAAAR